MWIPFHGKHYSQPYDKEAAKWLAEVGLDRLEFKYYVVDVD